MSAIACLTNYGIFKDRKNNRITLTRLFFTLIRQYVMTSDL